MTLKFALAMTIPFSRIAYRLYVLLPLLAALSTSALAHQEKVKELRVGLAGTAPFLFPDSSGIAVDIWQAAADQLGITWTATSYAGMPQAMDALGNREVDVVIGPVSISADRFSRFDLTQPWFRSTLSLLSRTDSLTPWERIKPFFSMRLLYAVSVFLFILAVVGALLWLAERRSNEQFPAEPLPGIGNGMWCAIVTMSTTGYGDIAPVTFAGRVIAGAWMVISIIFATTMVAGIASTLTLTGMGHTVIGTVDQLPGKRVAVLPGSPAKEFVVEHGGMPVQEKDLDAAYAALKAKQVDAVVFDRPQLLYLVRGKQDDQVAVSAAQYRPTGYGFAFRQGYAWTHDVNVALLELEENGTVDKVIKSWLGAAAVR